MYTQEKITKRFYDGLEGNQFWGLKCTDCGNIEFPPYPACNACGHVGNEWVDITSEDVTVHEVIAVSPMMTIDEFMPYAPIFTAECTMAGGPEFSSLLFGVTRQNYPEIRDSVPFKAKLVSVPMEGYSVFAASINNAVPVRKETKGGMDQAAVLASLSLKKSAPGAPDNGIDGTYKLKASVMGRTQEAILTIMAEGEVLTGVIDIMDTKAEIQDGKILNGEVSFSIEARGAELKVTGTVGNGKFSGKAKFGGMKIKLEGERE